MPKRKDEWKFWKEFVRELHLRDEPYEWNQRRVIELKQYPQSVQVVLVMAVTVAELMLEVEGLKSWDLAMCKFADYECSKCPGEKNEEECSFPGNDSMDIKEAKRVYAKLFKKMPKKWQKKLTA